MEGKEISGMCRNDNIMLTSSLKELNADNEWYLNSLNVWNHFWSKKVR